MRVRTVLVRTPDVPRTTYGNYAEAAAFGEAVLLALSWFASLHELSALKDQARSSLIVRVQSMKRACSQSIAEPHSPSLLLQRYRVQTSSKRSMP